MGEYGLLFQSMGFLLIIIALAYLAIRYGLKSVYRGLNGGYMKVLERTPLDPKSGSSLLLIQVGKEVYLIGTAQGGVNLLKTFNWHDLQYAEDEANHQQANFKDSFAKVMNRFRKSETGDNGSDGGMI
ncbi:MAG: flagellar biosynthetic protein FliO [Bacillota bacterium]